MYTMSECSGLRFALRYATNSLSPPFARKISVLVRLVALVRERDADALVQEAQLAQAIGERIELIDELREDLRIGLEPHVVPVSFFATLAEHLELGGVPPRTKSM